jgi:hypothetical protein
MVEGQEEETSLSIGIESKSIELFSKFSHAPSPQQKQD